MLYRVIGLILVLAAVPGGCWQEQPAIGTLAVWNQTSDAIEITAGERRESVPPCDSADWSDFPLRPQFEIIDGSGNGIATMTGVSAADGSAPGAYNVVVAGGEVTYASADPPTELPDCDA